MNFKEPLTTDREDAFNRLFNEGSPVTAFLEKAFMKLTGLSMNKPPNGKEVLAEEIIEAVQDVYENVSSDGAYADFLSTKSALSAEEIADYLKSNYSENLNIGIMSGTNFRSMTLQLFQDKLL
jgi:hypothetical protein